MPDSIATARLPGQGMLRLIGKHYADKFQQGLISAQQVHLTGPWILVLSLSKICRISGFGGVITTKESMTWVTANSTCAGSNMGLFYRCSERMARTHHARSGASGTLATSCMMRL